MEAYAVLETGGKQVLVKAGDTIEIEKLSVTEGEEVTLDTVCAVSDGTTGYSIADIANQPYYLIAVGVMVLALLLSLAMIRIEKELPKEMRPK